MPFGEITEPAVSHVTFQFTNQTGSAVADVQFTNNDGGTDLPEFEAFVQEVVDAIGNNPAFKIAISRRNWGCYQEITPS